MKKPGFSARIVAARNLPSVALLVLVSLLALSKSAAGKTPEMELNAAVEKRVLFYTTGMIIVPPDSIQYAYCEGRFIGQVKVDRLFPTYISGDVVSGNFKPYEGKLFSFGAATNEPPAGTVAAAPAPAPEPRDATLFVSKPSLITMTEPEPEKKEKPKPEKKKEEPKKKPEQQREVIKVPEPPAPKPEPVPTGPKRKGRPATNSFTLRYESHSDYAQPDHAFTSVLSSSKWSGRSIRTIYGMYEYKYPEETTTNTTVLGLNYIHFVTNAFYAAGGVSYTLKENKADNYKSVAFSLNKLVGYKKDKNTYLRLSGSYSSLTDFEERQAASAGANYYITTGSGKFDFGYKYLYDFDLDEHIQNRYSTDYTFPLSSSTKFTFGWRRTENVLSGSLNENDDSFRMTLTITN